MSNWISITRDTLYEAKFAIIIDLCDTLLTKDGQAARADGLIQGVINEVRNSVAKLNMVDADTTTIPKGLKNLTVDLITARLKQVLDEALTDAETSNVTYRRQQLRDIEKGDGPAIDKPDDAVNPDVENAVPPPKFNTRNRYFTSDSQDG